MQDKKKSIVVCGAGTMGSGIAQVGIQNLFSVVLFDIKEEFVMKAKAQIEKNLQYLVIKNKIKEHEKAEMLSKIKFTTSKTECIGDVVIEAIVENLDTKISLFKNLAAINNEDTILVSNTSSISISDIQKEVSNPSRFAGLHFFNPPFIMKLVEVVQGPLTSANTIAQLRQFCIQLNKIPAICKDSPGFIVNRVARPYYLESLNIAEQQLASIEDIDKALEACGFKMGPFRLMDLIGNDINLAVSEIVYNAFNKNPRFKPSPLQKEKVLKNELGIKTGKGFYNYS
ncbi:MAG: 3-hydroxybutyryl-CoA dehydrogenase [Bacteroidetes bacterium]|nr:3-hydroxybutyryl-CoA dehydrogenase [Bacteroidota bacterium]